MVKFNAMSSSVSVPTPPLSSSASRATSPTSATSTAMPSFKRAHNHLDNASNGVLTIPELIEFNARENGDLVFCIQASRTGENISISHSQLKQAIHNCRLHLINTIGHLKQPEKGLDGKFVKGPPIALLGESNAILLIYLLTLVSMGVPVSSPMLRVLYYSITVQVTISGNRQFYYLHASVL